MIEKVEGAYSTSTGAGQTKKNTVLAVLSVAAGAVSADWASVKDDFSAFIDSTVLAYNSVRAILPAQTVDASTLAEPVASEIVQPTTPIV